MRTTSSSPPTARSTCAASTSPPSTTATSFAWEPSRACGDRPQALYSALLKAPVGESQLPHGYNTSATRTSGGKKITFGLTDIACLYGNVIVQAVTSSTSRTKHGDQAGAVALERFALRQLESVGGSAA